MTTQRPGYGRFIPREELGDFASWTPGRFGAGSEQQPPAAAAEAAPPPPPRVLTDADVEAAATAARQAGWHDGYRDGLAALDGFKQSFATQATAQIGALLTGFDAELDALAAALADTVAATAVQLARQVLKSELAARPELVAAVAADAVNNLLLSARHVTVQVHPLDLPLVAEGADEVLQARGARLVADATIARGGVLVASDVGSVDARIGVRWAQAASALTAAAAAAEWDVQGDAQGDGQRDAQRHSQEHAPR